MRADNAVVDVSIVPTLAGVRDLRRGANNFLSHEGVDANLTGQLLLVISEVATNVVRHSSPKANYIKLNIYKEDDGYNISIIDDGGAYDGYECADTDFKKELTARESGMGLSVVELLSSNKRYQVNESENKFTFFAKLPSKRKTIAVVDDDPLLREVICLYLTSHYNTVQYVDGQEALSGIQHSNIDLVISDINMPNLDGITLRTRLSKIEEGAGLPFIFLTSSEEDELSDNASDLGIDDYLIKPVDKPSLLKVVERVFKRSGQIKSLLSNRLDNEITSALKPRLPDSAYGYRFRTGFRVAECGGGDFIYYHDSGDGLFVVLADVMGHGEGAKFFAHAYAGYFSGLFSAQSNTTSPGEFLKSISSAVAKDSLLSSTLVTCIAVYIDHDSVLMASSGHPQPLRRTGGKFHPIPVSGPLIQLVPQHDYKEVRIELMSGDQIMYMTDGLYDSCSAGNKGQRGLDQLNMMTQDFVLEDSDVFCKRLLTKFDELTHGEPKDDATFILLERE